MALSVSIELVSSSARVTSVKFHKGVLVSDRHPDPKIGPQVYLGPIKILFKTDFFPVFNLIKYSFNTKKEYLPGLPLRIPQAEPR